MEIARKQKRSLTTFLKLKNRIEILQICKNRKARSTVPLDPFGLAVAAFEENRPALIARNK
jgi:hypothetical protein